MKRARIQCNTKAPSTSRFWGQRGRVLVAARGRPNDPQVGGCAAPFAVVEECTGQLGPTPTGTWVRIAAPNKGEGLAPMNGVH